MPTVALRGTTILPGMIVHFDISRKRSIAAVERAMLYDQRLFVAAQLDENVEKPDREDLYDIGTIGFIKQVIKLPKGLIRVLFEGETRARLLDFAVNDEMIISVVEPHEDEPVTCAGPEEKEALVRTLKDIFGEYCRGMLNVSQELMNQILEINDPNLLMDQIIVQIPCPWQQSQQFLEILDADERFDSLCIFLSNEINIMNIRADIQMKIREHLDNNQREFVLREQMKVIREELGEDQSFGQVDEYREKAEKLDAPEEVIEVLYKEIARLSAIGENNPSEGGVIRNYIETLLGLPWNKESADNTDISRARKILQDDHYGLEKIKERILEYLAVRILRQRGDSPIICLVGPPGTGKTSIAKSVARALDKKYVRICLGGVRDEAEIRGHRRTYIGAMPGRIAAGLSQAGVRNPLMLLDEIDKVSSDYKGDTSSALLEVLDPEQNVRFSDHYVEVPIDLSEVLFIATANDASNIPRPLLDRMEVIEVASYTENEKMHIAKEHLIPKQLEANGIRKSELSISDKALSEIISGYTKEAGVRQLERMIARICRKAALKIQEENIKKLSVSAKNLEDILGHQKFRVNRANPAPQVGIVRGLAWTSVGGETLEVEVNVMPGKGEIHLTGQLGDVMKESAQAGMSYIRSIAGEYGIAEDFFKDHEIHVHIPEGAVPKDGPSAGITMALAILSALTDIPVRSDVAMTGEITLRGRVLPIGGLKEKMLAAKKAGIRTVLVPEENRVDVIQMEEEVTDGLNIDYVADMTQVIRTAFVR